MYRMGFLTFAGLSVRSFVRSFICVCLSVCFRMSVCLSVCLFVGLSVRQSVCLSVCLAACQFLCVRLFCLSVCVFDGHFVCLCVIVMVMPFPPPTPNLLITQRVVLQVCMSEVWGCASFLDVPQPGNRIRFVRACGRGEAACLRERDSISVAGLKILKFFFASGSSSAASIDHSVLHGIFEICPIFAAICMGSMPSRDFVKVWYGFCRIVNALLKYCMGCMNVV